ncbi:MAG: class I SAM-dependent methyltransferase, partial [Candidatus Eremiobacteraeota bacterium]|nr:class I SAM-dependent methyltransferase [Candidatus Eremiobacteraeota bacterium]
MKMQVEEHYIPVMGESRNYPQSYYLQEKVPPGIKRILDFGCGAGYWAARLSKLHPKAEIIGIDCGEDFLEKARDLYGSNKNLSFIKSDFTNTNFPDNYFDCVYADNSLEHAYN